MPLLEVISHEKTAKEVTSAAVDVGIRQGKTVIAVKDVPGFYVNRCLGPFLVEALALLQRHDRGECGAACSSPDALESALVSAAHRHWWEAARGAVDRLRRQNLQVGHETRRSLTLLRDEAGSVLTLLR